MKAADICSIYRNLSVYVHIELVLMINRSTQFLLQINRRVGDDALKLFTQFHEISQINEILSLLLITLIRPCQSSPSVSIHTLDNLTTVLPRAVHF